MSKIMNNLKYKIKFRGKNIIVDPSSILNKHSKVDTPGGGSIKIGSNCLICDHAFIWSYGGNIVVGDDCSVNPFCVIYGHGGLKIGNSVRIAAHTVIIPSNHNFDDPNKPIRLQGETKKGIVIEDDVWIGSGCRILDGVVIGKGSVIGSGSVVTKSIPPYSIAVGVPAKVIKKRGEGNV